MTDLEAVWREVNTTISCNISGDFHDQMVCLRGGKTIEVEHDNVCPGDPLGNGCNPIRRNTAILTSHDRQAIEKTIFH